jgi:hypothetical protein
MSAFVSELRAELSGTARVEVHRGPAFDTYPDDSARGAVAVVTDAALIAALLDALARADQTKRITLPALPGLSLTFHGEDGHFLSSGHVLTDRWMRCGGTYDLLLPRALPPAVLEQPTLPGWARQAYEAADTVEPALPAARRRGGSVLEHAQPGADANTLCGIPALEAETYRHLFQFGDTDCAECSRRIWFTPEAFTRAPGMPRPDEDGILLRSAWERRWPDQPPIAHHLRGNERWLRFHSLPGSKRYAENETEYAELLHRHRTVLTELEQLAPSPEPLVIVTCSWSCGPYPEPRRPPVTRTTPQAQYWFSVEPEDDSDTWTHLYVSRAMLRDPKLEELLRVTADDVTAGVLIADPDFSWLYHPYDGGADLYPPDATTRHALRDSHPHWLSTHSSGM